MTTNDEISEMMRDTWTIARTDCDGVTATRTFHSEHWPFALQQFVSFLKQDFGVDNDSVAINGSKHTLAGENLLESGWYGEVFYPESVKELNKEEFYSPESYPVIDEDDGWITWYGVGSNPVGHTDRVRVVFRNLEKSEDEAGTFSNWQWDEDYVDWDIIYYKVLEK